MSSPASTMNGSRSGLRSLLRDLADGGATLVRQEIRLARVETADLLRTLGLGTAWAGAGGVLLLVGALATLTGIILLGGDQWLRDRFWLAALLVAIIALVAAALLARRGLALVNPHTLAPEQTVATLKEDKEWLKRRLTSGATSS